MADEKKDEPEVELSRGAAFHLHLDECEQCREHPFDLCAAGKTALEALPLDAEGFPF
jgi:hypothetical protein